MDADFGRVSGATFTPTVAANGDISWTNDAGLDNPPTVNIKGSPGQDGAPGAKGDKGDPGSDATINGENALTIVAGDNINLSQDGGTVTLSANINGVFIYKGSATLATLPPLAAANLGFAYNMTEPFVTTADFIEGAGKEYSAGVNVAVADAGNGAYKYDALSIGLSGLVPETRQINGHALSADVTLVKSDVGLGNVDNTSDANKPISTATQAALNGKVDKIAGKGLSTEDYTSADKSKLSGMEAGANKTTIDGTLSVTGDAADAKATGDAVSALQAEIALLRELISGVDAPIYRTASGNPATFADGYAANVRALRATITPAQSGSGDPSPTNIRPISGVSSVAVTRSGEDETDAVTVTVPFVDGSSVPFVAYRGELNVPTGELTVSQTLAAFTGTESWDKYYTDDNTLFAATISAFPKPKPDTAQTSDTLCSHFPSQYVGAVNTVIGIRVNALSNGDFRVFLRPPLTSFPTVAALTSYLSQQNADGTPVQLLYTLATPQTYQLTPQQLATLRGYNAVSSDAGSVTVEYRADVALSWGGD